MTTGGSIFVLDDDTDLATSVARLLERSGYRSRAFFDADELLTACYADVPDCVITDVMLDETDGFAVAERLRQAAPETAIIFMTAWPKTSAAVDSIRNFGGVDYLEKPLEEQRLLDGVAEGIKWSAQRRATHRRLASLTPRERDVFKLLVRGMSNKMIAAELNIRPKTVEDHRASIMSKTHSNSLAQLIDLERSLF
jgi:FixJ family two-component response regulator